MIAPRPRDRYELDDLPHDDPFRPDQASKGDADDEIVSRFLQLAPFAGRCDSRSYLPAVGEGCSLGNEVIDQTPRARFASVATRALCEMLFGIVVDCLLNAIGRQFGRAEHPMGDLILGDDTRGDGVSAAVEYLRGLSAHHAQDL